MKARLAEMAFGGVVVVLVGAYLVFSISGLLFGEMNAGDKSLWGLVFLFAAISLVAGFLAIEHSPQLAGGLMVTSAMMATFLMWWFPVVPIVAFLVAAWGFRRAAHLTKQDDGSAESHELAAGVPATVPVVSGSGPHR